MKWADQIIDILSGLFLGYGILLALIYLVLSILATLAVRAHQRRSYYVSASDVQGSAYLPSVSLVAPAYNEGLSIVTNVRSLLAQQYPSYQLVVVNDGSSDDTMSQLITAYDLVADAYVRDDSEPSIETAPVRAIYRSTNPMYTHLTVIDKVNGGRADAINCGINAASTTLILCTDADCILEQDAVQRMVVPYLLAGDRELIACGAGIGIANDAIVEKGILRDLRFPKAWIARVQIVEYMRSFLLGRMAWSQVDGLMLVSGAMGLYPRSRLMEVGGLDRTTVGEDLELCIRLRAHMERLGVRYDVVYIPETLCFTEAPSTLSVYMTQRDRWARGLWETMRKHRYLLFNSRYGRMGWLLYPYWLIFELAAPIVEALGLVFLVYLTATARINVPHALYLMLLVYLLGCLFSTYAIALYTFKYQRYTRWSEVLRLLAVAYLESMYSHPFMLYGEMRGYVKKIAGVKSQWGNMSRKGFGSGT